MIDALLQPLFFVLGFIVFVLLLAFIANRWRVANANEAIIVAGARGAKVRDEHGQPMASASDRGLKVVVGGGTLVLPLVHRVGKLKLTARQISIQLNDAVTSQGIKVAVQGVATFKIGRDVESIRNAAERFLDAKDEQVDSIVKNVLEGSLRSIVGTLTIEELIMDRSKLMHQVQDSAKADLSTTGLQIDSFTIQSIHDDSGYVDLLGAQKLAIVERDARIARASADQEAAVREAEAEQIKVLANRDVALRRAETESQTAAADARAAQSGPLAQAEAVQDVLRRQTDAAQLEADRKAKELLSTVVRPAAAEAQAVAERAEGEKQARIKAAEGEAEQVRIIASAVAERTRSIGQAEADAIRARGEADAAALGLKAEAYQNFNNAAVLNTILESLPSVVAAAAAPMSNIGSLTVISNDGASELVKTTTRTVTEAAASIKSLTGIDLQELLRAYATPGGPAGPADPPADDGSPPRPATRNGGGGSAPLRATPRLTARVDPHREPTTAEAPPAPAMTPPPPPAASPEPPRTSPEPAPDRDEEDATIRELEANRLYSTLFRAALDADDIAGLRTAAAAVSASPDLAALREMTLGQLAEQGPTRVRRAVERLPAPLVRRFANVKTGVILDRIADLIDPA